MNTFEATVMLSCSFALVSKPRSQVLGPPVRVFLQLDWYLFNNSRFYSFLYKIFFDFTRAQFIVITKLSGDIVKSFCKAVPITMFFPFRDTVHVTFRIVASYPFISLLLDCRSIRWISAWGWIRLLLRWVCYTMWWWWWYSGLGGYSFLLTAQSSK